MAILEADLEWKILISFAKLIIGMLRFWKL